MPTVTFILASLAAVVAALLAAAAVYTEAHHAPDQS
jgi:hypothetical protein